MRPHKTLVPRGEMLPVSGAYVALFLFVCVPDATRSCGRHLILLGYLPWCVSGVGMRGVVTFACGVGEYSCDNSQRFLVIKIMHNLIDVARPEIVYACSSGIHHRDQSVVNSWVCFVL